VGHRRICEVVIAMMPIETEDFETLNRLARNLREASRFVDAAALFERALRATGGTERDRLWAKFSLGECLRLSGRFTEALANFGEVYAAARDRVEFHELAYRSFYGQIETLRLIQEAGETETQANLTRRLELVEEGLSWLRDIGREEWRHALLYLQSGALQSLGEIEQALDAAEEAYRLAKKDPGGPGYYLGVHVRQAARCARRLGHYERALQALDEVEGSDMSPLTRAQVLCERVRVLRAMEPPRVMEALDAARRMARMTDEIQEARERLLDYAELAYAAAAAHSFAEAQDALSVVREVALKDETFDRPFLLREARRAFQKVRDDLAEEEDKTARELQKTLAEWLEEIEQALEEQK
jgi:tetratricopeptide (TPR) repeat protein